MANPCAMMFAPVEDNDDDDFQKRNGSSDDIACRRSMRLCIVVSMRF